MTLRIKEAREKVGLSQKELAEQLNIKQTTFNGYETGAHDPKSDILLLIAKRCNTTVDFLLGLTNNPEPLTEKNSITHDDKKHLEQYNNLDTYGKKAVDMIIEVEHERMTEMLKADKYKEAKIENDAEFAKGFDIAAFGGDTLQSGEDDFETL